VSSDTGVLGNLPQTGPVEAHGAEHFSGTVKNPEPGLGAVRSPRTTGAAPTIGVAHRYDSRGWSDR
jgi:hypothetical protein